jgi:hypothetical protein
MLSYHFQPANEPLFHVGDEGEDAYFLLKGKVQIWQIVTSDVFINAAEDYFDALLKNIGQVRVNEGLPGEFWYFEKSQGKEVRITVAAMLETINDLPITKSPEL